MQVRQMFFLLGLGVCISCFGDTLIDDFSVNQGPVSGSSTVFNASILGGARGLHFDGTVSPSNYTEAVGGVLETRYDGASGDYLTMTFDGGNDVITPDPTGLNGANLGPNDGYFRFNFNKTDNLELWITVWSGSEYVSSAQVVVPNSASPSTFDVVFNTFDDSGALGGADFSSVGALQVQVVPADDQMHSDMDLNSFHAIPEPAAGVVMLGVAAAGWFIRRNFCM